MKKEIPLSHEYLLKGVYHGVLTTFMPDGQPQSNVVWIDYDNENVLINTALERQKGKNVRRNPKVSVIILDPNDGSTFLSIRGNVIEMDTKEAMDHLDQVTQKYEPSKKYYGDIFPVEQKERETRVILKIKPTRVMIDAIHK